MGVLSTLRQLFHRNGTGQRIEILLIEGLEMIEGLVLAIPGVADARVSVQTNAEHTRFILIVVRPTDRHTQSKRFCKLGRGIIKKVSIRIGDPLVQIKVRRMKNPAHHAHSPDPPLH